MGHFCPFPPRRIKRVTIPTILLSKHLRRSRLPLDYTYTSLKILKLSRATRPSLKTVWNDRVCAGCYTLFNAKPRRGGGGRERMCRSRRKKERKKETKTKRKAPSFFLPPTSQRDCPSSVRNRIRLIIPFFLSLITTSEKRYREKQDSTRERKEK